MINPIQNKKGFEFNFNWIFALLVGAMILFLASYAATRLINSGKNQINSMEAKEIGVILNPLETSIESEKLTRITLAMESRIYNTCSTVGPFGAQKISVDAKSGLGAAYQAPGAETTLYNKYIFSQNTIQGKSFVVLSKPFSFPFTVANLLYIIPLNAKFCFVDPPNTIKDDLQRLQPPNMNFTQALAKCPAGSTKVCFSPVSACDIIVDLNSASVRKNHQTLYYSNSRNLPESNDALLYGAIFADPGIYDCQVKRLMKRTSELSLLYAAKGSYLSPKGCSSNMEGKLIAFANLTSTLNQTLDIRLSSIYADDLEVNNELLSCPLF